MQNNKGQEEKEKFIMKKLLASLMALSMVFAVTGCSESSDSSSESKAEAKLLQLQLHLLSSLRLTQQLQLLRQRNQLQTQQLLLTTQTQQAPATRLRELIRIMFTQAIFIHSRLTQRSGQCRSPLVLT